jgi:bifunctional DNA-binding transcriptional regulator/antitoxin component of YhaV-PrlF toxin-antitoxin module
MTIQDAADGSGDGILLFPDELLEEMGWIEGDVLDFQIQGDGSVQLQKIVPPCSDK